MIEGSGDERRLAEITHGSRDSGNTIWTGNAQAPYWKSRAKFPGDLGRVYGVQWRHWQCAPRSGIAGIWDVICGTHHQVDQLHHLIQGLKNDSNGRRHVLTAWNPAELDLMALPPCHMFAQFYVREGRLSCQMYQRSADFFLGVPFNIASYSLLTHMIAQVCGLQVGEFIHVIGDAHIYLNHIPQVTEQLSRIALAPSAVLQLTPNITNIDEFTMSDIHLINYDSYGGISATMAV
jgi:thymidylate synthase